MAFKKVELTEEEQKGSGRKFKKFEAIGDKVVAFFVKTEKATARYPDGDKEVTKYVFWNLSLGEFEITPTVDLDKRLKKAMLPPNESEPKKGGAGLAAGMGHLVLVEFTSTLPIEGKNDPMKVFNVEVDTAPPAKFSNGAPAFVFHAKSGQQTKNAPPPEDDIPF